MRKTKKVFKRFPSEEVAGLVERAQAGDLVSQNELLDRFDRLVVSLVTLCRTGRVILWSKHPQLLKLFGGKDTPLADTAAVLKNRLAKYSIDEIFHTARTAAVLAVPRTEKNYASTVVIVFKELIEDMIKDDTPPILIEENTAGSVTIDEEDIFLRCFIQSLPEEEAFVVEKIVSGERLLKKDKLVISKGLGSKVAGYLGLELPC